MGTIARNSRRFDLSDTLIHFVRALELCGDDYPDALPDEFGLGELVEDTCLSPFFLLRRIVRQRQILSTWSMRSGQRTIYGHHPAVCFTEMPLAAFVRASAERQEAREKISRFAIVLPRDAMAQSGARPVIYGTSVDGVRHRTEPDGCRTLSPALFHERELYRYVAFGPGRGPNWLHEREWRWPNRQYVPIDPEDEQLQQVRRESRIDADGFNLDGDALAGVGLLCKEESQRRELVQEILYSVDRDVVPQDLFGYVLRIPDLEQVSDLHDPDVVANIIEANRIDLASYFNVDAQTLRRVEGVVRATNADVAALLPMRLASDGPGRSAPCIIENDTPVCRALVSLGLVEVNSSGRYILRFSACEESADAVQMEHRAKVAAELLTKRLGTQFSYYTLLRQSDPTSWDDGLRYTGAPCTWYTNFAHRDEDF